MNDISDLDRLKTLLDDWAVPYIDGGWMRPHEVSLVVAESSMEHRTPDSDRVEGFPGFFTRFVFTDEGMFLRMGAWE